VSVEKRRPPLSGLVVALIAAAVFAALVPPLLYATLNHGLHPASAAETSADTTAETTKTSITTHSEPNAQSPSPSSGVGATAADAGRAEALAIAALVAKSGSARKQVIDAVNGVSNCSVDPLDGENAMTAAADTRQQVLDGISGVPGGLPEAGAVLAPLQEAMRQSIDANRAFGAWMGFVHVQGCNGKAPVNNDFADANAASARATAAKKAFVAAWNPIAARYGLSPVTETDL
jgi:hypothetical protein